MSYLTTLLSAVHKKAEFSCGTSLLDNYLHTQAKQDVKRKLAACFILADDQNRVKGYYTLSSAAIPRVILPENVIKKLPPSYVDLPATLMGRLAVDQAYRKQGLGEMLLMDALKRSYDASVTSVGSMAVVVDPIDQGAASFYNRYGFILLPDSGKMFIAMETVAQLF
jgi:GNAT superfamily N-acetyltransferase